MEFQFGSIVFQRFIGKGLVVDVVPDAKTIWL